MIWCVYSGISYWTISYNRLLCRLGTDINGSKLGFVRNLVGQAEKWVILKANTGNPSLSAGLFSGTAGANKVGGYSSRRLSGGEEEPHSSGSFVRIGDHVLLQAIPPSSDYIVSLHESADGRDIRLQHKDKVSVSRSLFRNTGA